MDKNLTNDINKMFMWPQYGTVYLMKYAHGFVVLPLWRRAMETLPASLAGWIPVTNGQ